jgi:signal transduction histidine kinase
MHKHLAVEYVRPMIFDVFQSVGVALGVLDADGTLVQGNTAWFAEGSHRQIPLVLQSSFGKSCLFGLRPIADRQDNAAQLLTGIESVLAAAVGTFRCEWFEHEPDPRWFEVIVNQLEHGRGVVISSMDVSTRKRAAAVTASQIDELARNTRLSTMSLLAAAAGHELNQPLLAVTANAEAALLELRDKSARTAQLREIIIDIAHAARRATEIIDRMRRLLSGGSFERSEIDLNAQVREVVQMLGDEALRQRVRLHYVLDPRNPTVYGDPIQVQQVLINLLNNAIDVTINAPARDHTVEILTAHRANNVEICVNDHGPALEPAALKRMFEPLYTTKRNGMGLGLYITRAIVQSHGGHIEAQRLSDHGLSMRVVLPAVTHTSLDHLLAAVSA